jgi:hypothetical protein
MLNRIGVLTMTLRIAADGEIPTTRVAALTPWQRMEVEAARKLVGDLEQIDAAQLAGPLGAYWAGRLEGACQNLLAIVDAVVIP